MAEGPNKGLADLKKLIEAGKLVPVVDRTYQLSEVPEALRYFGEGSHKGKVVISMESQMSALDLKRALETHHGHAPWVIMTEGRLFDG